MKKLGLLTLVPLMAYAQMQITTQEFVSHTLKPDILRSQLSFEEHSKKREEIKLHLNTIISEFKKFDSKGEICRGGGYQLSPSYSYKDQKQEFLGYNAYLNFTCEFESIEQYNKLNTLIDKTISSQTKRSLGPLAWGISDQLQEQTQQMLRATMISKTLSQASAFSKITGMKCEATTINFSGGYPRSPMMMLEKGAMSSASVPTESPIINDEESRLDAMLTYSCQ